jgi:ADP-heptose:LPS heptosyltransferase
MRILIISLAGIGDTLFATPLIHELRASFPDAQIDALVLWAGSRDVLEGNPHLNNVFQRNLIRAANAESLRFLWQVKRNNYDVTLNTHPQSRIHYRAVARFINAPTRISHEYDHASIFDRLLVNRTIPQDYQRHSVENNLAFLALLGKTTALPEHEYEIYLSPEELAWADNFVAAQNLSGRKVLGVHVGSGGTKNLALRRWPLKSYLELINHLRGSQPETAVVLFGGPEEQQDHAELLAQAGGNVIFDARTKNLRQAAALLTKCAAFLSVDTALMHLAAAMKVPGQIVIETPTWNAPIQPYNRKFTLVKNPAVGGRNLEYYRYDGHGIRGTDQEVRECMASVSVDSVYQAVVAALK